MSAVETNQANQTAQLPRRRYVRRRDRLTEEQKKLHRREQRKLLHVSQSYWSVEQDDLCSEVERQRHWELVRRYGDFSLAYSTVVQPLLKYHKHPDVDGFIAYRNKWGMTFVLGDPVVAPENRSALIESFCKQHRRVTFCQVSKPTARILAERGFYVNELGVDTTLDLPGYDFAGKEKEWLRYASNWIQRRNYQIKECSFDDVDEVEVESLSETWRDSRTIKTREGRFLNRPIVIAEPEPDVRKFYLFDPNGKMQAFVFMDPLYREGQIVGYVTAFKRRLPEAPKYAEPALMKAIIEKLKSEQIEVLKLGLSPAAWLEDKEFKCNWWTSRFFQTMFRSRAMNRYFYNIAGHANYKRRFRGQESQTYLASPSRFNTLRIAGLVGLCGTFQMTSVLKWAQGIVGARSGHL